MNRKLLQQALDVIKSEYSTGGTNKYSPYEVMEALEAELAKPEQESVSHLWECLGRWSSYLAVNGTQGNLAPPTWLVDAVKAATAPPRKEWVGLTDEELNLIYAEPQTHVGQYARAIEAKLKEKNT